MIGLVVVSIPSISVTFHYSHSHAKCSLFFYGYQTCTLLLQSTTSFCSDLLSQSQIILGSHKVMKIGPAATFFLTCLHHYLGVTLMMTHAWIGDFQCKFSLYDDYIGQHLSICLSASCNLLALTTFL